MFEIMLVLGVIILGLYGITNKFDSPVHLFKSIFQPHNMIAIAIITVFFEWSAPYIFENIFITIGSAALFYGMLRMVGFAIDGWI